MANSKSSALLSELRQMAERGEIDETKLPRLIFASQIDVIEQLGDLQERLGQHVHLEYATKADYQVINDEVKAWKNRVIGIGIGAALSGATIGTIVTKLLGP